MTTSNTSDLLSPALSALPRLPRDEGGPVFAEPWQAQAFALAVRLSEQGHYTWKEWAAALAAQLRAADERGEPDDGSRYYEHWLAALEGLVIAKGLVPPAALRTRKDEWIAAYQNTPHGQPVGLQSRAPRTAWLLTGSALTVIACWLLRPAPAESAAAAAIQVLPWAATSAGFGMMLGMRHALEPDHLAAVSTLMTGERSSARAAWLGAWWGLGHTLTLLVAGALLVTLQTEMPVTVAQMLQLCVILLLISFGIRALYQGACPVPAGPTHSHRPAGALARWRASRAGLARPFLVGAVHGLAGSGALVAMIVTTLPSTTSRLSYLLLFGVGSTVAMAALSGLLGWPLARFGGNRLFVRTVALGVGAVSTALGLVWAYPLVHGWFS
jgi:nitrile hydratase accessory protein